ncbi:DUF2334 domain-containing protein [Clostridium nigeriense]|uniref:DUF2334 domain-containing protein n=1 Tax=Clostridium nigeriense TaxID=1805470 RepID=UPI0008298138|nr:DUF2334 domain-containing protein [Clostridium nigeriense]
MKKNKSVYSFILILAVAISLFNFPAYKSYGITHSYYNTQGQEFIRGLNSLKENNYVEKVPYSIALILKNNKMNFKKDILYKNNRLYIPIGEFIKYFGLTEEINGDDINIGDFADIKIQDKIICKEDEEISLRGDIIEKSGEYYISLFDLCEILELNTYWDYENNKIYISKKTTTNVNDSESLNGKNGYIRFEDFTAGDIYLCKGALEKVRLVTDYMKRNNESFSISWIPRYINNDKKIDNDISKEKSMENSNFVFTLDYIVNNGGNIGLHGYTHQYKNSNSVSGVEFGDEGCNNLDEVRKRVEDALGIAKKLNIPISYWETPHYKTTAEEQKIFEEYFSIIYEPSIGLYNKKIITSENNEVTKYIPTPLGYVDDDNGDSIIERMINCDENQEFSLFYHLSMEIKSINITINNGNIEYKYKDDSILKKIVKLARKLGYRFSNINFI